MIASKRSARKAIPSAAIKTALRMPNWAVSVRRRMSYLIGLPQSELKSIHLIVGTPFRVIRACNGRRRPAPKLRRSHLARARARARLQLARRARGTSRPAPPDATARVLTRLAGARLRLPGNRPERRRFVTGPFSRLLRNFLSRASYGLDPRFSAPRAGASRRRSLDTPAAAKYQVVVAGDPGVSGVLHRELRNEESPAREQLR